MHDLDVPRRYRTIIVCGGLGLGSTVEPLLRRGATLELDGRRQPAELADIIEFVAVRG